MEMTGEFRVPAPRQLVWQALNDPEILKQCIPGCQELDKLSDTEFAGKVVAAVGPVRATFSGKVTLSDLDPPESYTISGEGSGGVAGFAKGGAKVNLAEDGGGTVLSYAVQAQVGGKLAQIGSRLIDGVARKMAGDFFRRFAELMAPEQPATAAIQAEPEALAPTAATVEPVIQQPPPTAPARTNVRLPPALWITGLAAIVILMLYLFTGQHSASP
jgi:carbon monoxide dehydrogenase subunit G